MKSNLDSKLARSHLRAILKEMGKDVDPSLNINSWELLDLAIKNIHLVNIEIRNLRKEVTRLQKEREKAGQRVIDAIANFYAAQDK